MQIQGFRKLDPGLCLEDLGDGLTLVSGENEEGKSTFLAALKAALFEHHRVGGEIRSRMAAHGGGTPRVELEFEVQGRRWRLDKTFHNRGPVTLVSGSGRYDSDAAEQQLQQLLRFQQRSGRAQPMAQHHGLQSLFWLDQGTSFAGLEAVEAGRERLAGALAAEVGMVAGGEQTARLRQKVEAERDRFWSRHATPVPVGEWKKLDATVTGLRAEQATLRVQAEAQADAVERLARARRQLQVMLAENRLGEARRRLAERRQQAAAIEDLGRQVDLAQSRVAGRRADWIRLDEALARRRQRQEEHRRLAGEQAASARQREELVRLLAEAEAEAALAVRQEQAALVQVEACALAEQRLRQAIEQARLRGAATRLRAALDAAEAAARDGIGLEAALARLAATPERVQAVRKAHAARSEAAAALRAGATRLELHPDPGATARIDGRTVATDMALEITGRTEIELRPFGRIVLLPGSGDTAAQDALRQAEAALRTALDRVGAADLVEAERLLEQRRLLAEQERAARTELKRLLEGAEVAGLDDLRRRVADAEQRLGGDAVAAPDEDALHEAGMDLQAARQRREQAAAMLRRAEGRVAERRADLARHGGRIDMQAERLAGLARELEREEAEQGEAALGAMVQKAALDLAAAQREADERSRQLAQADPARVADLLEMAERAVAEVEDEERRLRHEITVLETGLQVGGADRTLERLAQIEGELEWQQAELARQAAEARAWRLLHESLAEAERAAQDGFLAPVRARLQPLLATLVGEAEPLLDPGRLTLTAVRRGGHDEPLESLSVGTREQLGILVRIAFARLLQDREGEASCLILDDALVYADERRLEAMKLILLRAARDLQIILLTCRPKDYEGLSSRHLRLQDCRLPVAAGG